MKKPILPADVAFLLKTLDENGYEAYIVGGCVRDSILRRTPQDWDITTSALPEETAALFPRTFDTGIQHGTITVVLHKTNYEITTYRIDGKYADCRHPDRVFFTRDLTEDLLRRDFTMNAIAYHPDEGFRDPFGGQEDIAAGLIRGVGDPALRFQEDALRMLRCVRFAAQLGFRVEENTYAALCANTALIQKISVERVREELEKLWRAPYCEKMSLLWESGLLAQINPVLSRRLTARAGKLPEELAQCGEDSVLRWCVVLQDYTPKEAEKFLNGMKFDRATPKRVCLLLERITEEAPVEPYPMRKLAGEIGEEAVFQLLTLQGILRPDSRHEESRRVLRQILAAGDCLTLKTLAFTGKDLMEMGVPAGKEIGRILSALLDAVQREPARNTREVLAAEAERLIKDLGGSASKPPQA